MIIKQLLAHKNKIVVLAVAYTVLLTYSCLITPREPIEIVSQSDKLIHALAYFVFTILWFVALFNPLIKITFKFTTVIFLGALIYGILIEYLQHYCTLNRQGDVKDVLANVLGTLIALIFINVIINKTVKS